MSLQWNHKIFGVNKDSFKEVALDIFRFQASHNPVYKAYIDALGINPADISSVSQIPFLPIRFFKTHEVKTTAFEPQAIFESSGTTGSINSKHFVKDVSLYEESFLQSFALFYGNIEDYAIFALLPSYLQRGGSSLVYMADKLIALSKNGHSKFYLDNVEEMNGWIKLREHILDKPENTGKKNILIGVTYALLDFAEKYSSPLRHTIIMETGGMKGRREEMIREQVHDILGKAFDTTAIHSEYGMTELLSQAYSKGNGIFNCPPWMKILLRDEEDPLQLKEQGSGIINVIDLANIFSCSFIATDDAGKLHTDGSFEVLGRVDGSDIRGCSLMAV